MKYDKKMNLVKENELAGGKKTFGPLASVLKKYNDKLHLFYYQLGDENEKLKILHSEINSNSLEAMSPKEILEIDQKNFGFIKAFFGSFNYKLNIISSPDQSKLLILWTSDQVDKLFFAVLDSSMNIIRQSTEEIAGIKKLSIQNACIDNAGNVFIGHNWSQLYVSKHNGDKKNFVLKPGKLDAYLFFMSLSSQADILFISGVFSETADMQDGVFSQSLNISNMVLTEPHKTVLPKDLKDKLDEQLLHHYDRRKNFSPDKLTFRPVIKESGEIDLFAMSSYSTRYSTPSGGGYTDITWGSFLYIKMAAGKTTFIKIPKVSSRLNDYIAFFYNDKVYIFYKDDERNKDRDIIDYNGREDLKTVYMGAIIDENNNLKREIVSALPPEGGAVFEHAIRLSPSAYLIPGGTFLVFSSSTTNVEMYKKSKFFWTTLQVK
jgi:hypothetical protein